MLDCIGNDVIDTRDLIKAKAARENGRKGGRPRGKYGFRVRGEIISRHTDLNRAVDALRRHNHSRKTRGTALYADVVKIDSDDTIIAIGHDTYDDGNIEWYDTDLDN